MPLNLQGPITYLITSGQTAAATTPSSEEFSRILTLVRAAVAARISLVQLREKKLSARVLFELTVRAAEITRASPTRLLVNDRADIASAAGADGVHLTARSIEPSVIRRVFLPDFLIGVSTHTTTEARAAHSGGADFAVFGPVFDTESKREYGEPVGLPGLSEVAHECSPFPIIALGGVTSGNAADCLRAGASGVAGIRIFGNPDNLAAEVENLTLRRELRN